MAGFKTNEMSSAATRCSECRRKTLMLTTCACERIVCLTCRYPEEHDCTFDHQADAKKKLEKENPAITGTKLDKL